jgi:hypothetical protein
MLQYSQQKQSSSNVHTRRQQYLCCLDVPALPLLLQNAALRSWSWASERLLMVAGNTSNVHAEQCVARASFDDDGATAGGRPQRSAAGRRTIVHAAKGTCSVIIAAT